MKISIQILLLSLLVLCFSCKHDKSIGVSCKIINGEFTEKEYVKLSDFVESIEVVPLETNSDCLVHTVGKIQKCGDAYCIGSATDLINKILVFDKNGKFVYKLDKRGMGPDEYTDIRDFDVIDKDRIAIISRSKPSIYVYDMHKDTCLLHRDIDIYPNNILVANGFFYIMNDGTLYNKKSDHLIFKYDEKGDFVDSYFRVDQPVLDVISTVLPLMSLSSNSNGVYFNYPFSDVIYKIEDAEIFPEYKLDFGEKSLSMQTMKNVKDVTSVDKFIKKNKGVNSLIYYAVNSPISFFTFYDYLYNGYVLMYNEASNQTLLFNHIVDDLCFKGNKINLKAWNLPVLFDNNIIYWHIEPTNLIKQFETYKKRSTDNELELFKSSYPQLVEVIRNVKEDDNPIILKLKLKSY